MPTGTASGSMGNSRGPGRTHQLIKEYNDIVLAAEIKVGEDVEKLLGDATRILDVAGRNYTHAMEQGFNAFQRIHEPARKIYEEQFHHALAVQESIIRPAKEELARVTTAVKALIDDAIQPIEQIYSDAMNSASNLTSGMTLGGNQIGQ